MDRIDRIATIGSSILTQAENESRALIEKANDTRKRELQSAEEEIILQMGEHIQRETAKLRAKAASDIATERTNARESILRRRSELTKRVFDSVEQRLLAYAETEEYRTNLLREIESVKDRYDYDHAASTVYLREKDMALADKIRAILPGARVEASKGIKTGGWQLMNEKASVLIDQTLDTRKNDQKGWYLEHCNLEVV